MVVASLPCAYHLHTSDFVFVSLPPDSEKSSLVSLLSLFSLSFRRTVLRDSRAVLLQDYQAYLYLPLVIRVLQRVCDMDVTLQDALVTAPPPVLLPAKQSRGRKRKAQKDTSAALYCLCGYGDGEMVFCDSGDKKCLGNHWYHLECVGLAHRAPRGEWWCPDCKARGAKPNKNNSASGKGGKKTSSSAVVIVADESNYVFEPKVKATKGVLTTASLVKVEAAERQSRKAMEDVLINARLLGFNKAGQVVRPESGLDSTAQFPDGLCRFKMTTADLAAMQSLHRIIVEMLAAENRLTPWAGVAESDARKRGYAFLPSCYGHFGKQALTSAGVNFHAAEKSSSDAKKDEQANWHSCVRLSVGSLTDDHISALETLVATVKELVPAKYRSCISIDKLQALQPNLHHGRDHLPGISNFYSNCASFLIVLLAHLDSPLHDGFGVVIVTVCVHQGAQILLLPSDDALSNGKPYVFDAAQGEVYVLSGASRNIFDHGVVCENERRTAATRTSYLPDKPVKKKRASKNDPKNIGRESLNLRFHIHGNKPGLPFYVGEEIPVLIER